MNWDIRAGDVISFVGFLVAGILAFGRRDTKIALVVQELGFLKENIEQESAVQNKKLDELGELIAQNIRIEERMRTYDANLLLLRQDMERMKNGEGFINGPRLANAANP